MLRWIVDMNQALLWFPADWRTLMIGRSCISIICCTVHSLVVNFLSKAQLKVCVICLQDLAHPGSSWLRPLDQWIVIAAMSLCSIVILYIYADPYSEHRWYIFHIHLLTGVYEKYTPLDSKWRPRCNGSAYILYESWLSGVLRVYMTREPRSEEFCSVYAPSRTYTLKHWQEIDSSCVTGLE